MRNLGRGSKRVRGKKKRISMSTFAVRNPTNAAHTAVRRDFRSATSFSDLLGSVVLPEEAFPPPRAEVVFALAPPLAGATFAAPDAFPASGC
jgi:hypothetical protein